MKKPPWYMLLAVISIGTLIISLQIVLIRVFAIYQYHYYAFFAIVIGLLGMGVSGTFIHIFKIQVMRHASTYFVIAYLLFYFSILFAFLAYSQVDIHPEEIGEGFFQYVYFLLGILIFFVPFLFGGLAVGISLYTYTASSTYSAFLLGNGLGVLIVLIFLNLIHPFYLTLSLTLLLIPALIVVLIFILKKRSLIAIPLILIWPIFIYFMIQLWNIDRINPHKEFAQVLSKDNSEIVYEDYSPYGLVQVVTADQFDKLEEYSDTYTKPIPQKYAMVVDSEKLYPIYPVPTNNEKADHFLRYSTKALAYELVEQSSRNDLLLLGVGNGSGVLRGLIYDFDHIDGVELNHAFIRILREQMAEYTRGYLNYPQVQIVSAVYRNYTLSTDKRYDLIELMNVDDFSNHTCGIYSLRENYTYTEEAIVSYMRLLKPDGFLTLTRWLEDPPRDAFKLFATVLNALKYKPMEVYSDAKKHIALIRKEKSITLIIRRSFIDKPTIERIKSFANSRQFDLVYYPGITKEQVNRYAPLEEPYYYEGIQKMLNSKEREHFVKYFPFDIRPINDIRPYYFNFVRQPTIALLQETGTKLLPFSEWGYFSILMMLIPVSIVGFVLMFLPILVGKRRVGVAKKTFSNMAYFFLISLGIFFLQFILVQRFMLFLGHPIYSFTLILGTLFISAAVGAKNSVRFRNYGRDLLVGAQRYGKVYSIHITKITPFYWSLFILVAIGTLYMFLLGPIFYAFGGVPFLAKGVVAVLILIPLGFFMGMPFTLGISSVAEDDRQSIPWAWSVFGIGSVLSVFLAQWLSILNGYQVLNVIAFVMLIGAFIADVAGNQRWR